MNKKNIIIAVLIVLSIMISVVFFYLDNNRKNNLIENTVSENDSKLLPDMPDYDEPASGKTIERTINLSTGDTAQVILPEEMKDVDEGVLENIIKRSKN